MKQALLLSGAPGVGKTTIIKQTIDIVKRKAGGFYTREIRQRGERQGFEIVTLDGASVILAHVNIDSPYRVSKYGIDIKNLDLIGVAALRRAIRDCDIVVIDEIGKIELFSEAFRETVVEALDSRKKLLGTIMFAHHPWADKIKKDFRVLVRNVTTENRHYIYKELITWLEE